MLGSECKLARRKLAFRNLSFLLILILCTNSAICGQVSPSVKPSGKEGVNSRSSVASESSDGEPNNHNHNYHRHHRHSSSKSSPAAFPSSSSSTYPGYPDYSPVSYSNPADTYYEPRYYERPSREFSARSTSYPAMVAAPSSQVGFTESEYGGLALATGHGSGHGGGHGGHGDGYGHGHHTTYYKTVNKVDQSSLGLLGLLGLLSLLSNVLLLLTTTAAATTAAAGGGGGGGGAGGGRRRRDTIMLVNLKDEGELQRKSVIERLSNLIVPSLNVVGHAKDGRLPVNCTYQEMCKTNRVLVDVFGVTEGRPVASVMSTAITKMLSDTKGDFTRHRHTGNNKLHGRIDNKGGHNENGGDDKVLLLEKLLTQAGLAGRNGEDCETVYPTCDALRAEDSVENSVVVKGNKSGSRVHLPFLITPDRATAIILGQT